MPFSLKRSRLAASLWIFGTITSGASGRLLSAQTLVHVFVPQSTISSNNPSCFESRRNSTAEDSVVLRVIDTDTTKSLSPKVELEMFLDGTKVKSLGTSETEAVYASPFTKGATKQIDISTSEGGTYFCSVVLQNDLIKSKNDSIVRAIVAKLTAEADSVHAVHGVTGNSYVELSLIKSIAGVVPPNEFFDVRLKFGGDFGTPRAFARNAPADTLSGYAAMANTTADSLHRHFLLSGEGRDTVRENQLRAVAVYNQRKAKSTHGWTFPHLLDNLSHRFFLLADLDVSLSTAPDTTAADSAGRLLTDATLATNLMISPTPDTPYPERTLFVGSMLKVFNRRTFLGPSIGGLELNGSALEGSSISVAAAYRVYRDSVAAGTNTTTGKPAFSRITNHWYAYLEYYLRVPKAQFLDKLRVSGGLLLPLAGHQESPSYRVALSVPIVDLTKF